MILEDHTIVLAFSGALTPIDFVISSIIPLIKAGFIDIISTTGANLYHVDKEIKREKLRSSSQI